MRSDLNDTNEHGPLRDRLRKLPKVGASGDFELRLKRRLVESEKRSGSIWIRIPAFAYFSAAVVVTACVLLVVMNRPQIIAPPTENVAPPVQKEQAERVPAGTDKSLPERPASPKTASRQRPAPATVPRQVPAEVTAPSVTAAAPVSVPDTSGHAIAADRGIEIDQRKTTTGTLELSLPESLRASSHESQMARPHVRDQFGVGVLGKSVSGSLSDSAKTDSLKRLRKLLLKPKAVKKPNE